MRFKDLTNKKFGKLTVIEESSKKNNKIIWKCACDCGNVSYVTGSDLKTGNLRVAVVCHQELK